MWQYILITVIIVVVIILIYWICKNKNRRKRKSSEDTLRQSAGVFDAPARAALHEINAIDEPLPTDYFRRGNLIRFNILGGNLGHAELVNEVAQNYIHAMDGLRNGAAQDDVRDLRPDFMIHQIMDFGNLFAQEDALVWTIMNVAPHIEQNVIRDRAAEAKRESASRADAINKYFDLATHYTDDRQNVHDSKVNNDLREILTKFRQSGPAMDNQRARDCINDALRFIDTGYALDKRNADKPDCAKQALAKIAQGELIGTFGEREDYIFALTWSRCSHPMNAERTHSLKCAVIDALAATIENGTMVCINGRCSQILNSLATLDFDPTVSGAMTYEAYRNQIFQETKQIIDEEITRAQDSTDASLRKVGELYAEANDDIPGELAAAHSQFIADIRAEIDRNIESYSDKLTAHDRAKIAQECYVYATL